MRIETNKEIDTDSEQVKKLCKKYKYIYAVDKIKNNELTKKFYGNNNLYELQQLINNSNDKNYYQVVLYNKSKLYIDLDHLNHTPEQIEDIIENIINEINKLFDVDISNKDLIIQSNNNKKIITSLHIIIKSFYTDRKYMKEFIKYMNEKKKIIYDIDNKKYELEIDDIYTKTRQFRLCNNKKINKDDSKLLINFSEYDFEIEEEWIDNTENLEYKKIKDEYIVKEEIKEEQKIIIDKLDDYFYSQIIKELKDNFYKSRYWKILLSIIEKKFEFINSKKEAIIEDFLYFSAEKSNGKYTFEQNKEWYQETKNNKYNYNISRLSNILNNYTNNIYTIKKNIPYNINKIMNITKLKKEVIEEEIKKNKDKNEIEFENNIIFDKSDNILYTEQKIYNLNEDYYKYKLSNNKLEYDKYNIKPNDIEKYIDEFIQHKHDIYIIRGKWSCGKTHYIMKPIIKQMKDKKILIITENQTLNEEYYTELKQEGFINHKQTIKKTNNKIIISVDSLHKLNKREFDLVIFDEFETIASYLESSTVAKNNFYNILSVVRELEHYIKSSKQLLFLDADISKERVNNIIYQNRPKNNNKYFSFTIDNDNYKDCKYYIYLNSHQKIRNKIINDTLNKSSFVLSTTSKIRANRYYDLLLDIINNNKIKINICLIDGEGLRKNNNNYGETEKNKAQKNITQFLEDNNIDIFIFTPTFKTGANIRKHYKRHYSIGCNNSVNVRIYNQMLHRTRKIKDKELEYHIYIEKANYYIYRNYLSTIEDTKKYLKNINIITNRHKINNNDNSISITTEDKNNFLVDDNYLTIRGINYNENYNQKKNFFPYLIYTLKFTHNSNIIYIDGREDKIDYDIYNQIIKDKNELENKIFVETPLINEHDLNNIKGSTEGKNEKTTIKEYEPIEKFMMNKYYLFDKYNIPIIRAIQEENKREKTIKIYNGDNEDNDTHIFLDYGSVNPNNIFDSFLHRDILTADYNNKIKKKLDIEIIDKDYYKTYNTDQKINYYLNYDKKKFIDVFEFIVNNNIIDENYYKNNDNYIFVSNQRNKRHTTYINKDKNKIILINSIRNIIKELSNIYLYKNHIKILDEYYKEYDKINIPSFYNQIKIKEYQNKYKSLSVINYLLDNPQENNIISTLDNDLDTEEEEQEEEEDKNDNIKIYESEHTAKNKIILQLLDLLKLDIYNYTIDKKNIITNKELFEIYKKIQPQLIQLEEEINIEIPKLYDTNNYFFRDNILDEFNIENSIISKETKEKINKITNKLNKLLNRINIMIKYCNRKNTHRAFDKLKIAKSTYDIETYKRNITEKQKKYLDDVKLWKIPKINNNNNYDIKDLVFDSTKTKIYNNQLQTEDGKKLHKYKTKKYIVDDNKDIKINLNTNNDYIYLDFEFEYTKKENENIIYRPYQYNKKIDSKFKKITKKNKDVNYQSLGIFINNNIKYFQNKELYYPNRNNMNYTNDNLDLEEIIRYNIPKKQEINIECHNCLDDIINIIEAY